jgi:hypothetical protein
MKLIPLSNGHSAIVDDADFVWLSKWRWYAFWNRYTRTFYAYRPIKLSNGQQRSLLMHRAILPTERSCLIAVTSHKNMVTSAMDVWWWQRRKRTSLRLRRNSRAPGRDATGESNGTD